MATKEPQTEEITEAPTPVEEKETSIDAVLVLKKVEGDSISTEVQPLGDVQATEVQTLLELGVKRWRNQIGLA